MTQVHQYTAVLFSDIEGYTAIMQKDEGGAIELVNRYRQGLEKTVARFKGKVQQYYGDGSITTFDKASNALNCALELQQQFAAAPAIPLRVGVHYGKVVFHQKKMFGDTVNLSSRIESLGKPRSVLVSQVLINALPESHTFKFISLGVFRFKNVAYDMEIFALDHPKLMVPKRQSLTGKLESSTKPSKMIFAGMALVFLMILGLVYLNRADLAAALQVNESEVYRSVAVLPFTDNSKDSSQTYLAEGLAEELLLKLAQEPQLRVISRASSFSFAGSDLEIPVIARRLGVKYILDGSVSQTGDSIRINTQLVDAQLDQTVWAMSWPGSLANIFVLQDKIADSVKNYLKVRMPFTRPSATTSTEAYTLFLQAKHVGASGSVEALNRSIRMIERVLQIDPNYAPAWGYLSYLYTRMSNIGAIELHEGREKARSAAFKTLAIDSSSAQAFNTLSTHAIYYLRDFETARIYVKKALELEPGTLAGLKLAGNLAFCLGEVNQAIEMDEQAILLDPVSAKNHFDLGYSYFFGGKGAESERITRQGLDLNPDYLGGQFMLCLALLQQGKLTEAREAALKEPYEILRIQAKALVASAMEKNDSSKLYLQDIKDRFARVAPYQVAQVYAFQNQKDSAFHWLHLAHRYRDGGLMHVKADPFMKPLHSDSRWQELMDKMGFTHALIHEDQ